MMDGIRHIGDGLLEVNQSSLNKFLAEEDINLIYDVEHTPFARGKFATVRRAIHKKTGKHYAAKFLKRRRRGECLSKDIHHEISVLMWCAESENIVKLHGVHETRNETALILEMASGGELQAMIDEEGALTEEQTRICMKEILKGLRFMHKKCIAHLDLKPQNILLAGKNIEDGLKLCDFGISRLVVEGGKLREILGTPDYVAPEVLQYEPLSLQTDIWSVGVLAYVLLTGFSPFGGENKQETYLNISQCSLTFDEELFENVSADAIDFIKSTLRIKPNDRLTVSECLEHKWLQDNQTIIRTISLSSEIGEKSLSDDNPHHNSCHDLSSSSSDESACNSLSNSIVSDSTNTSSGQSSSFSVTPDKELISHDDCQINDGKYQQLLYVPSCESDLSVNGGNGVVRGENIVVETEEDDHDKENILVTNYISKARELNIIIISDDKSTTTTTTTPPNQTTTTVINLFPDAPTTPKVCRKAPDSPTSVKALVKKFQLENTQIVQQNDDKSPSTKCNGGEIVGSVVGVTMTNVVNLNGGGKSLENGFRIDHQNDDDDDDDHPYCNGNGQIKPSQHKNHIRYFSHSQR